MMDHDHVTVLDDKAMALYWWNFSTDADRAFFMEKAGNTGRVIDAWHSFKEYRNGTALKAWIPGYLKHLQSDMATSELLENMKKLSQNPALQEEITRKLV